MKMPPGGFEERAWLRSIGRALFALDCALWRWDLPDLDWENAVRDNANALDAALRVRNGLRPSSNHMSWCKWVDADPEAGVL